MPEAALLLNDRVRTIQNALEQRFIFRKLGLCYDYASDPEDFPRKTLPTAKEARENQPNAAGLGTGMADCTRNGGLLFDGYLLRLELGVADPDEERIFDRLIGGLIRIATTAPKGYLARGLTPDGRGFYNESSLEAHLFWAFAAWRGFTTSAIAVESQGKIQNIASRWIARLEQDRFTIPPLQGRGAGIDLTLQNWERAPVLLALLAVAHAITDDGHWRQVYEDKATENNGARLSWSLPADATEVTLLLNTQLALHLLAAVDEDESRQAMVRERMRALAGRVAPSLRRYADCKQPILEETPDLDWRALDLPVTAATVESGRAAFRLPMAWRRILHEAETVATAMEAALVVLLAGDRELAEPHAEAMADCLRNAPWDQLWLAHALAPAASVHARGVELELWETEILARPLTVDGTESLVAPYLAEDFDDEHPEIAGHTDMPPRKRKLEEERQRAAKQAKQAKQEKKKEGAEEEKTGKPRSRSRGRRRRRRRKKR